MVSSLVGAQLLVKKLLSRDGLKVNDRVKHSRTTSEEDIASSRADDLDGWTRQLRDHSIVQLV